MSRRLLPPPGMEENNPRAAGASAERPAPCLPRAALTFKRLGALGGLAWASLAGRRRAAGYLGLFDSHNLGDALMLPVFRKELAPLRLHPSLLYRPLEHRAWRLACRRAFGACILGGGTLVFWEHYHRLLAAALEAGVPCYALGTGVPDPEFWRQRRPEFLHAPERWAETLRDCRFVGVRGPLSRKVLEDLGCRAVEVVGDPALLLARPRPEAAAPAGRPVVGVNFGAARGTLWGGDEQRPLEELAGALRTLIAEGWGVRLYCVWPHDRPALERLAGLAGLDRRDVAEHYRDAGKFMDDVSRCAAFAGMKLHATALALCAGVPALELEYRPKCRDFMLSVGLEELCVRCDGFSGPELAERLKALPGQWPALRGVWETSVAELTGRFRRRLAELKQTAGGAR